MRSPGAAALALALTTLPAVAGAEAPAQPPGARPAETATPVIGGTAVPPGAYPDVAAVNDRNGEQACTGVLIAPTVVLTAGHCMDIQPGSVLVGTSSLARAAEGELLPVARRVEYPSSWTSFDVGVLVLGAASHMTPRPIATGWARLDIVDGAAVDIVGYGAIDRDAQRYVPELQQATTTITDAGCTQEAGCNAAARPDGELGAGGMGIDTCPGDSGGPLYLPTPYGTFLAGVTSRGYDTNQYYCSEGGIYVRPDKIVAWIEEVAGVPVARGPEPAPDAPLVAVRGHAAEATIVPGDPVGAAHTFAIATPPASGAAAIRGDGLLRVCAGPTAGTDAVEVTVTDAANPARAVTVRVPVTIEDGAAGEDCDPRAFEATDTGGCCEAGASSGASLPLALGVLAALRRRRARA